MTAVEILVSAGAASGAAMAVGALAVRLWRGIRHLVAIVDAVEHRTKQLENNGGSSVKDKVDQMWSTLDQVIERLDAIERQRGRWRRG